MSTSQRWSEKIDKENTKVLPPQGKKEKGTFEEPPLKKKVLGEASNMVFVVDEEPSSPEDSRLLNRKREMKHTSCAGFSIKLSSAM